MTAIEFIGIVGTCLEEACTFGAVGFIILLLAEEAYERWKARK